MSKKALMWVGCGAMLLAGVYFLWSRGYTNIFGYVMLLLCPLSHLLLHRGHDHAQHSGPLATAKEDQKSCH